MRVEEAIERVVGGQISTEEAIRLFCGPDLGEGLADLLKSAKKAALPLALTAGIGGAGVGVAHQEANYNKAAAERIGTSMAAGMKRAASVGWDTKRPPEPSSVQAKAPSKKGKSTTLRASKTSSGARRT